MVQWTDGGVLGTSGLMRNNVPCNGGGFRALSLRMEQFEAGFGEFFPRKLYRDEMDRLVILTVVVVIAVILGAEKKKKKVKRSRGMEWNTT